MQRSSARRWSRAVDASLGGATEAELVQAIEDPSSLLQLTRGELVRLAGIEVLSEVLGRREGREFLTHLFASREWMEDLLVTGPINPTHAGAHLHALCTLFRYDKEAVSVPLYRRLATAYARQATGDWEDDAFHFNLLDRFQAQKEGHRAGRLHASFDGLEAWEMAYTLSHIGDSRSVDYMLNQLHYQDTRYHGACWTLAYRLHNHFGDSIHGPHYYPPWANEYPTAELRHRVGGVCGTLSNYGAGLARIHGIPSFAVGQPGHCAYMVRTRDKVWSTAYSVTGNTGAGSVFGGGDESIVRLMQEAYDTSRPALLTAYRHNWQANHLQSRAAPGFENIVVKTYAGIGSRAIPDFSAHEPTGTFRPERPEIGPLLEGQTGWVGAVLKADLVLTRSCEPRFQLVSDDGSRLSIGHTVVVDHDGLHGPTPKDGRVALRAGTPSDEDRVLRLRCGQGHLRPRRLPPSTPMPRWRRGGSRSRPSRSIETTGNGRRSGWRRSRDRRATPTPGPPSPTASSRPWASTSARPGSS